MSDWNSLVIKVPGKDLLEKARGILETLVTFLEIAKALLQLVQAFLIDFGNPIRVLVEALLKLIQQLFESLRQTGLFMWEDFPSPSSDPNFTANAGGYRAFTQRFIGSLYDGRDPFRPQPSPGITKSGFILIAADADSVFGLLQLIKRLQAFFGRGYKSPQYAAPGNAKVLLAGTKIGGSGTTDPILQVASAFQSKLEGLVFEWGPAQAPRSPNPDFSDMISAGVVEFKPQKYLIERSINKPVPLTVEGTTAFEDKRGKPIKRKEKVRDEYGDLFKKFDDYVVVDPSTNTSNFVLGQLGKFRFIDKTVDKDATYYYRVRAFSGDLDVSGNTVNFGPPTRDPLSGEYIQKWPSTGGSSVVMGRPTAVLTGRVPVIPENFDVLGNLENVFKSAYSLGFHLPVDEAATFDSTGLPTGSTSPEQVGRGSLYGKGGLLSNITPELPPSNVDVAPDPVTGEYPQIFYDGKLVRFQAARLTQLVGRSLLETPGVLEQFRTIMQGPAPRLLTNVGGTYLSGATTIEAQVSGLIKASPDYRREFDPMLYPTYSAAFQSPAFRLNVLAAVRFITSFTLGGTPPDWRSASLLQDIIPWSGQFIYDLLARIDALVAAFQGVQDEIKAFIDLLIRKIDTLESFLKYLIEILNFLDSFGGGFYILKVASTDGGIPDWVNQVTNAGGTAPLSGPKGFTGGIALAWAGPNIDAFTQAIDILF